MDIRLALAIAGLIAVVLRYVAARRVMGGDGRFAWLLLVPSILVGVALVSLTVTLAVESRLAAAAVAPVAIGYVGLLIWFGRRFQRTVSAPPNPGDPAQGVFDAFAVFAGAGAALVVIAAVVLGAVVIVLAVLARQGQP
ncbi:MAG: hypothetical protein ACJ77B_06230 [Chloroflexota bacterium]